jgi:hypothetical protein
MEKNKQKAFMKKEEKVIKEYLDKKKDPQHLYIDNNEPVVNEHVPSILSNNKVFN